jgi:polyisoprenoid-binding protein YceI
MVPPSRVALTHVGLIVASGSSPLAAQTVAYTVDPAASHVRLHLGRAGLVKFLGHDHDVEAPIAEGRIEVVDGDPGRSSVTLRFEAPRLALVPGTEAADEAAKVEDRMRGPEVLDVARSPEIAFASTSVERRGGDGAPSFRIAVKGTLALRGREVPVEIPLEVARETAAITARGELVLSLRDLGVEPPSVAGVVRVADRFRIELDIRASADAR